jgi:uncharacterized membrane protein (DUF373 family)
MVEEHQPKVHPVRQQVVRGLSFVEDIVYAGLGVLLAVAAVALLVSTFETTALSLWHRTLDKGIVGILDQILLVLLITELLYTVQVSFRKHELVSEPFLVVALIAVVRRILVIAAQLPQLPESAEPVFRRAMWELAILTAMILALVGSLILLQKHNKQSGHSQSIGAL